MSRIALLTPYARPVPGGISTYVDGLARLLRNQGHEVAVLAGEGNGEPRAWGDLGTGWAYRRRAHRALRAFSPQVIHAHSHWYTMAAGANYVARFPSTRLVFSFHTTTIPRWRGLFSRLLSRAHVVTFVSCVQLEEIRRLLHLGGDLRLMHPATELPENPASADHPARPDGSGNAFPLLGFVGPLEYERKVSGVVELVRTVRALRETFPDVKLLIVGDGRLRRVVEREAAGLGSSVEITGYVADAGVLLDAIDIYCHISRQEGLPLALLEAMAHARAVVATPVGGIPEIIDESNGVLVEGRDGLFRSIVDLAESPEIRARLGSAARETIREGYTWEARWPVVASVYGLE